MMRIVTFLLISILAANALAQSNDIYLQPLLGNVRINGTNIGTKLAAVVVGDIIETGRCSQGQLHTNNGSLLLGPEARLTVGPNGIGNGYSYPRLQLQRGGFSLETPRVQGNPSESSPNIVLRTPESEITVYHGVLKGAATNSEGTLVMGVGGQTTIRDSDGNIVSTDQYGAGLLQLRSGYQPGRSRPGDNPLMAMVLDAISPACVSDALGDGSKRPSIDVSAISFCEGPGWENCTRRQRILEITGVNAVNPPNTYSPVHVRTVEVDGSPAMPSEGWAVNVSIYRAGDVNSPVENTSGLLTYDGEGTFWLRQLRSPSQPGKYDVYFTLYCSRRWDRCGTYQSGEWKEKIAIEVTCNSADCVTGNSQQTKGSYITATESYSESVAIAQRTNGELVALIAESSTQKRALYSTVSTDLGESWTPLMPVADFLRQAVFTESANGELILLSICPRSSDWCFYKSQDAQTWAQLSVLQLPSAVPKLPKMEGGSGAGMTVRPGSNPPYPESIIQDQDGGYMVSYMLAEKMTADVYVRQSRDLRQWSDPVLISTGQGINQLSRVMQKEAGDYAIAYYSRSHESVVIAESGDGVNWTITQSMPIGRRPSDIKVLQHGGKIALLLAYGAEIQMLYPASNDTNRTPPRYPPVQGDVRMLVVIEANRVLGAAFIDHTDERQDVMFTPIRALENN